MEFWGLNEVEEHARCFGLPTEKMRAFSKIKSKVWNEKLLSQGGKILIKVVALSVPNYTMSCFKLPHKIRDEIEQMMARFWWEQKKGREEYSIG